MKFLSKREMIIILIIIIICLIVLFFPHNNTYQNIHAEIYHYNDLIHTVNLSEKKSEELNFEEAPNVYIKVSDQSEIYFYESDCPDKICIHSGKLSAPGQTAACLPNGIMIKIVSGNENEVDIII